MNDYKVTPEQFVKAWEASSSLEEVSRKLGIPMASCSSRAQKYRSRKVPLKKMSPGKRKPLDIGSLKELVANIKNKAKSIFTNDFSPSEDNEKVGLSSQNCHWHIEYVDSGDLLRQILGD